MSRLSPLPRMPETEIVDMLPDMAQRIANFYRVLRDAEVPEQLAHELTMAAFHEASKPLYVVHPTDAEAIKRGFKPWS